MRLSEAKQKITELESALNAAKHSEAAAQKLWIESEKSKGPGMAAQMDNQKLKHQLELVGLIAEGKTAEAIQCLLRPDQMIFTLDIRFGDDKSRIAAEEEMLQRVVGAVRKQLDSVKLDRTPSAASVGGQSA